jgi:predicted AAA+ superfamily ATPase
MRAYPIHPEVFDRLYDDWAPLDNFQRTRGVLKLMAKVIHRLWKDGNSDGLIMPGSLPLYDVDTRNEAIQYLPQGWDPVLERDIDGERAETTEIEKRDARLGSVQACRRTARAIFLGSAPNMANLRGLEAQKVLLGCAQPGQQTGLYKDALRRLADRLHFINSANNRFWFDTRPNLRREMEERKRRFHDTEDVFPVIRDRLQRSFAPGVFAGVHTFTASGDIPDDFGLRLVVLPPDAAFSKAAPDTTIEKATAILKSRGDQPRQRQNRLLFLAADYDSVSRLKEQVRSLLAWQSIVTDIKDLKLNLDQLQAKQANKSLDDAGDALKRMIRESYRWLLAPVQDARPGKGISEVQWEHYPINPSADSLAQEIERVLKENELVIMEWAPVHLSTLLKTWFWKEGVAEVGAVDTWQKTCAYLYMPRLKEVAVFRRALEAGAHRTDFFGVAYGKHEDEYEGFSFGTADPVFFASGLLLIEPATAAAYAEAHKPAPPPDPDPPVPPVGPVLKPKHTDPTPPPVGPGPTLPPAPANRRFYGTVDLSPVLAKKEFADLVDEVLQHFTAKPGVKVRISVEMEAESGTPFDEGLQRAVRENCNSLKFKQAEFEVGE